MSAERDSQKWEGHTASIEAPCVRCPAQPGQACLSADGSALKTTHPGRARLARLARRERRMATARQRSDSFLAQTVGEAGDSAVLPVSLRDYFAGLALGGWVASLDGDSGLDLEDWEQHRQAVAEAAYGYADAMLAERSKRRG